MILQMAVIATDQLNLHPTDR